MAHRRCCGTTRPAKFVGEFGFALGSERPDMQIRGLIGGPMRNSRSTISTDRRATWVLALVSIASLMVALDMLMVTTALSTIRLHLRASLSQLDWTVNAYTLSVAVLLLPAATLGERYGRRRILAIGLGVFTAASAACALAPSVGLLIAARAVQGAGSALVIPTALALLG